MSNPARKRGKGVKPKRPHWRTDDLYAKEFKLGSSVDSIAWAFKVDHIQVEAAIRRVLLRQERKRGKRATKR